MCHATIDMYNIVTGIRSLGLFLAKKMIAVVNSPNLSMKKNAGPTLSAQAIIGFASSIPILVKCKVKTASRRLAAIAIASQANTVVFLFMHNKYYFK